MTLFGVTFWRGSETFIRAYGLKTDKRWLKRGPKMGQKGGPGRGLETPKMTHFGVPFWTGSGDVYTCIWPKNG